MVGIMQGPTVISSKEFTYGGKMTAMPHITRLVREKRAITLGPLRW